jgi:hypothetical protein
MKHKVNLDYPGGLIKLAGDVAKIRYDALYVFLEELAHHLVIDAIRDDSRGRHKLAAALNQAADSICDAWVVCKPYMKELEDDEEVAESQSDLG